MREDGFDVDAVTNAIRSKESRTSGGYNAKSKSSSASGAYQYINKTWKGSATKYGVDTKEFPTARSAPKEVQDKVFTNDLQKNASKYGSLEKAVNVHYSGNPEGKVGSAGLKANRGQTGSGYMTDIKKRVDDYNTERKSTMGAAQQMAANFSGGSKSLSTPDSTQFAKAPEEPKSTQVASAPEAPKMQNPDQNITKVASSEPATSSSSPIQVSQLDTKSKEKITEGTTMSQKEKINEAIVNLQENKLNKMKQNFSEVLQEKAMEKLEERKKVIAANYFAQ